MSERESPLAATLRRLHEQLGEATDLDHALREQLRTTLAEIRETLDTNGSDQEGSLAERVAEVSQHFEETHPALAETLRRLVDALANLGI